jgi:dTDP-4-dehydrorhamnose reductase
LNIAIVGANGQLGSDVAQHLAATGHCVYSLTHGDIEVANIDSVAGCLGNLKPEVVVNTSAMHNLEACEQEVEKAYAVNVGGPRNLAMVTNDLGALLIHVSSDYVFDGAKSTPYLEDDLARPLSVYGRTKLEGERVIGELTEKSIILRTSALYGKNPCRAKGGFNFVERMLAIARDRGEVSVVKDEVISPTTTVEVAEQIETLIRCEAYGLYHATAEGQCSWYEFARETYRATGTSVRLTVASASEFPCKTPRPKYSVLENRGLKRLGINRFSTWQSGLYHYLGSRCILRFRTSAFRI